MLPENSSSVGECMPAGAGSVQNPAPRAVLQKGLTAECFPRAVRILCGNDYNWVFAQAERSRDGLFTVLARWRGDTAARLGLAVSKKAARRAVDRNRIKRLVREGFRHRQMAVRGLDIVVIARQGIGSRGNCELRRSLNGHWSRLRKVQEKKARYLTRS